MKSKLIIAIFCSVTSFSFAQNSYKIDASKPGITVSPSLYGIFFEEINHAGEGGLYAEMVENRDFEITTIPVGSKMAGNLVQTTDNWQERKVFENELHGWTFLSEGGAVGDIRLQKDKPLNDNNPHSMRLIVAEKGNRAGVWNKGFWGMNLQMGDTYNVSFYARTNGNKKLDVTVSLESSNGKHIYASKKVAGVGGDWQKYECSFMSEQTDNMGRLSLTINQADTLWLDAVSMFPEKTYNHRKNGLRTDIMEKLTALKPAFIRFPGGAIVGGMNLDNRIQWKKSIGNIVQRKGTMNLWGYYTSNGLGYHEYLQMCEDLDADALWVCNPGFSDNYRKAEYCKPEEVKLFVQEALDALEYALGPVTSEWGAKRAANGHPEPFPLKYIEIGNEATGDIYSTNYKQFYDAIRPKYPQVKIICNYKSIPGGVIEIRDDHKYGMPSEFIRDFTYYDKADRKGPKIYVGEYGCTLEVGQGNLTGALAEAVYLMGLEKNSDIVTMSSYAPLFFHVNDNAWPVNMIGFDNQTVFGRTSYWVNYMMVQNRPDVMLNVQSNDLSKTLFCTAGFDKLNKELIIKVVNTDKIPQRANFTITGVKFSKSPATVIQLTHKDPKAENTLYNQQVVVPQTSTETFVNNIVNKDFPANSMTIIRIKTLNRIK
jgi:alpha-L-arabinofuranosidase